MAEYIKKEDATPYLTKYIPSVEAVERSKIDKAIEDIKQDMIAHSGTGEQVIQAYCDGLKKALKYLENIGE
jgi:hypothetical protein